MIDVRNLDAYKRKGECFAITSYCNNENKVKTLNKTIDNIKQYGLPIFVHAHYPLPDEIQKKVDFYFYSSDNPIFTRFNTFQGFTEGYEMTITEYDSYYTAMKGWDESIKILSEYEKIHLINYDTNVYPELFEMFRHSNKSTFLQHNYFARNKPHIFLLYFCLHKNDYKFFRENITLDKYIGYWAISQSTFLPHIEELIGSFVSNNINYHVIPYTEYSFDKIMETDVSMDARWNWDKTGQLENCKIFIGENNGKASILFYDVMKIIQFEIGVYRKGPFTQGMSMGGNMGGSFGSTNLTQLEFPMNEIERLTIRLDGVSTDETLIRRFFNLNPKIHRL